MIKNPSQAEILDVARGKPIIFDVNFGDERYKDCVRMRIGTELTDVTDEPDEYILKYTDLFSFMFTLGTKEQQAKMIPVREELGTEYMKTLHIRCTKDMKEGEEIVVNVKIHVPTIIEESIKKE